MNFAEVTVQYVNPPKGRARSGSIKDTDGAYWGIEWPAMQHSFKEGGTYKVKYEQNGQYRNIKDMKLVSEGSPAVAKSHSSGDPELAERIYVCGIINSWLSNPNFRPPELTPSVLVAITTMARQAWAQTFGAKAAKEYELGRQAGEAIKDDMNDEIPW